MTEAELHTLLCAGLAQIAPEADLDELPSTVNIREELDIDSFDFFGDVSRSKIDIEFGGWIDCSILNIL